MKCVTWLVSTLLDYNNNVLINMVHIQVGYKWIDL